MATLSPREEYIARTHLKIDPTSIRRARSEAGAIVLVGESNPYRTDGDCPLFPWPRRSAAERLRSLIGWCHETYLAVFERYNLCDGPWSMGPARERALRLSAAADGRPMLLCGRRVAHAFGLLDRPYFAWVRGLSGAEQVVIPHPSGRNRELNDEGRRNLLRQVVAEACRKAIAA